MPTESEIRKKTFQEIIDYISHSPRSLSYPDDEKLSLTVKEANDVVNAILRGSHGLIDQLKCLGGIDTLNKSILINGELKEISNQEYCEKVLLKK